MFHYQNSLDKIHFIYWMTNINISQSTNKYTLFIVVKFYFLVQISNMDFVNN